jgi:hypothetical protein
VGLGSTRHVGLVECRALIGSPNPRRPSPFSRRATKPVRFRNRLVRMHTLTTPYAPGIGIGPRDAD